MSSQSTADPRLGADAAALRRFSRFFTRKLGLLGEGLLDQPFSLAQSRLLYELVARGPLSAATLAGDLAIDPGYVSRLVKGLEAKGLIERRADPKDRRLALISPSSAGRAAFAALDAASQRQAEAMLAPLGREGRRDLVAALGRIEARLDGARAPLITLRPPEPGDIAAVLSAQARLYAEEYGWNWEFEALVMEIGAAFIRNFDPAREQCWIAERDGAIIGSIFLVKESDERAKLRLLYVAKEARGLGIGARLVSACIAAARAKGYRVLGLWTNDILQAARRLYEAEGFQLVSEEKHHSFGKPLVGQFWELALD